MLTKHPKANLRSHHLILTEIGLILSLLVMIAATTAHIESAPPELISVVTKFEPIVIDTPPNTEDLTPPAPIRPQVPIEVPNHKNIVDIIDLPEYDINSSEILLPPPPANKTTDEEVMDLWGVEIRPEIKGGMQKFYSQLKYPEVAQKAGIEGLVTVSFIVNKEGEVSNIEILRGIGGGCDEEVIRVLKLTKFSAAIQNGRFVPVKMTQNVRFNLQN